MNNTSVQKEETLPHVTFDFSEMRTERTPQDDIDFENADWVISKPNKALENIINGVTKDNPRGVLELVHVRVPVKSIDKLKGYGIDNSIGYQTIILNLIEDFIKDNNL